jgi:hypothetical protein
MHVHRQGLDLLPRDLTGTDAAVASRPAPLARPSGNDLEGAFMFAAYVTVTIVAALFTGSAAVTYLIGHEYPKAQADVKGIPRSWVPVLGALLAAGTIGLLAGFAVPLLGILAAAGLVLYFTGALIAHLRVGSRNLVGWTVFFVTEVAALVVAVAYHR